MKLIVGLGNPGDKYIGTRHNLGFEVVEKLGDRVKGEGFSWKYEDKFKSEIFSFTYTLNTKRYTLLLAKPQTFMNESGIAIKLLTTYYKLEASDVIVVHDDLDLPLGKIKIRKGGSAAGHHGVESVIEHLKDDQFIRIRLGIGPSSNAALLGEHKKSSFSAEKFVLETFGQGEKPKVKQMIKHALLALEELLDKGLEEAQNQYN